MEETSTIYDLIVIGGGVVGLAVLRAATLKGYDCALIESEPHLLSHASGSNSGIVCTGVDAAPNTLERALIRESNSLFRIYCRDIGIPLRPCGSLVCTWPWDPKDDQGCDDDSKDDDVSTTFHNSEKPVTHEMHDTHDSLDRVLEECHLAGDTHASRLTCREVQQLEPNLSSECLGAIHVPGEIVVDPWLFSISLAVHARENGARIWTSFEFDPSATHKQGNVWNVVEKVTSQHSTRKPRTFKGRVIVNAAGLWADVIQEKQFGIHDDSNSFTCRKNTPRRHWTAKPRRGQYRIYSPKKNTVITHPIQPIPTQRTKGIFVFSSIYNHIVVGPTASDQESKVDCSIDPVVGKQLDDYAKRIVPGIDTDVDFVGEYVGIRPGTEHRDYQIHVYPEDQWIAVAGIRSTGLTASLGIGNYVVRSLSSILDTCQWGSSEEERTVKTTPLPSLEQMVLDFDNRQGEVQIHGHVYKVTHPLTQIGWSSMVKQLQKNNT